MTSFLGFLTVTRADEHFKFGFLDDSIAVLIADLEKHSATLLQLGHVQLLGVINDSKNIKGIC